MENILIQHIEITPGVRGGKPRLAGSRITVTDIVIMHLKLGQSVDEIATEYNLSLAGIHAALAYYYDHQAEIDRLVAEDEAFAAAFQQQNPSKLQAKILLSGNFNIQYFQLFISVPVISLILHASRFT